MSKELYRFVIAERKSKRLNKDTNRYDLEESYYSFEFYANGNLIESKLFSNEGYAVYWIGNTIRNHGVFRGINA